MATDRRLCHYVQQQQQLAIAATTTTTTTTTTNKTTTTTTTTTIMRTKPNELNHLVLYLKPFQRMPLVY